MIASNEITNDNPHIDDNILDVDMTEQKPAWYQFPKYAIKRGFDGLLCYDRNLNLYQFKSNLNLFLELLLPLFFLLRCLNNGVEFGKSASFQYLGSLF